MLEHDYREPFHTHEHLWADTHTELIFSTGEPYYRHEENLKNTLPQNFLLGPQTRQLLLYSDGITGFIAARFLPGGFAAFSTQKATDLVNNILSLPDSLKSLAKNLQNKSRDEKLQLITNHFVGHVPKQIPPEHQKIQAIAQALRSQHGRQKIAALTKEFEISPRMLERNFLQYIGLPAKLFARILRFNHARNLIDQNPDIGLAALAYETGYTDQAHFSRNFRQLFDLTPAQFKAKIKKFKTDNAGQDHDVVFVQD